ncbi:sensor histidine kinase [Actinoplanes friuliensis]|jgi:two-component system sensor histidine kinase BaeS|uniref:histidine kinase n=1 Tax=Actinoplanes friuliensis DSM 7358 TaxID=1246995 RepID=U5W4B8_9ACTN|nr:HAMP domain-containing sensor histidine kinase [Actinoplanes friuliensis]AGZ43984.1 two-component system histidine kinase [Actinoplanes friuliensis DSM 7358]
MSRSVPVHRSLVVRLLGTSVLIVVLAVATAAWLAAKTATRAVQEERGQSLAGDSQIYDTLLGFAAGHRSWNGIELTVRSLSEETGRQITLTRVDGTPIAASHPGVALPDRPTAVVDPLGGGTGVIDARAVGPYRLPERDRAAQRDLAEDRLDCLRDQGFQATLQTTPSGRSVVRMADRNPRLSEECSFREDSPTTTEREALEKLKYLVNPCLKDRHLPEIDFYSADFTWQYHAQNIGGSTQDIQDCVDNARRMQLRPYVAPPARLYLSIPARAPTPVFDLSAASTLRIAGATAFVLLVAVAATLLVGLRLVRPLRALTAAADSATHRPAPVTIARNDEIGRLATALNDLAERSERGEDQRRTMVNDIAHELRSPLTIIRGWLTAGQDGLADLDQDLVRLLLEESGLLQHIVDDLADLADADAGTLTLTPGDHPIADLLAQVAEAHRAAADRGGVDLRVTVAAGTRAVVDPVRFRQIVGNLLANAIRHTPAGGAVEVRARLETGDLLVEVADSGEGIGASDLPHVFDRFWRADKARGRATGGSGLGLSIARRLSQAHGGELTAFSTVGVGSVFTVRLPAPGPG